MRLLLLRTTSAVFLLHVTGTACTPGCLCACKTCPTLARCFAAHVLLRSAFALRRFGIGCVVPPAGWRPPFALDKGTNGQDADSFRFSIRKQLTSHLCMRSPNTRADRKKRAAGRWAAACLTAMARLGCGLLAHNFGQHTHSWEPLTCSQGHGLPACT